MSSKRAIRRRSCQGKVRHATSAAGWAAVAALRKSKGALDVAHMNCYHCRFCSGFHIGHMPSR